MISPLMTRLQSCQGCPKILVIWSNKIQYKLNEFDKPSEKKVSLTIFVQFWLVFQFLQFWLNFQFTWKDISLVVRIFWHPWHPLGRINSGVKQLLVIYITVASKDSKNANSNSITKIHLINVRRKSLSKLFIHCLEAWKLSDA